MSNWDKEGLLELISEVAPGSGTAEHESDDDKFFKNFLPIPNYRQVLEPDTLLVLGGRGAGKTELFRLLAREQGRKILVEHTGTRSLPPLDRTLWIAAFGRARQQEKMFPPPESVENATKNADNLAWRSFWLGLILGVLLNKDSNVDAAGWADELPAKLQAALKNKLSMPSLWFPLIIQYLELANHAVDKLDDKLKREDRWLFITYDELDRLVPAHVNLAAPIRELLAFWLDRWRRWERIRPKIFLRTDLFQDEFLGFPDASKLQGHQVKLEWQSSWLYQLFIKRLANSSDLMRSYLEQIPNLVNKTQHNPLGLIPTLDDHAFAQFVEKLIGKYMGSTPRKGFTYSWIPNHLQDAGGRIAPRSFLKLFSLAAQRKLQRIKELPTAGTQLLQPSDLQGALMSTSEDRIKELQEEYPWLEALKSSLAEEEVPMPTGKFVAILANTEWSQGKPPPSRDAHAILRKLLQLGIVDFRSDARVNMPEIYLYGFKLKRRGGIKRPK